MSTTTIDMGSLNEAITNVSEAVATVTDGITRIESNQRQQEGRIKEMISAIGDLRSNISANAPAAEFPHMKFATNVINVGFEIDVTTNPTKKSGEKRVINTGTLNTALIAIIHLKWEFPSILEALAKTLSDCIIGFDEGVADKGPYDKEMTHGTALIGNFEHLKKIFNQYGSLGSNPEWYSGVQGTKWTKEMKAALSVYHKNLIQLTGVNYEVNFGSLWQSTTSMSFLGKTTTGKSGASSKTSLSGTWLGAAIYERMSEEDRAKITIPPVDVTAPVPKISLVGEAPPMTS